MKDPRRNLRAYRQASTRLRAQAKRHGWTCWRCHEPFDFDLPYYHRDAFTADHITPLAVGGDILGALKPAHRRCNSKRNDGTAERRLPTTRQW